MTLEQFKSSLSEETISNLKTLLEKTQEYTDEEAKSLQDYLNQSAEALGEDQITEALRYILSSIGGLRATDLQAVIGDEFNPETFEAWNNLLGAPFFTYRELPNCRLYDASTMMRHKLVAQIGENNLRSCASDLGYYLLEHKEAGDMVRDVQITHLLLDGGETAAVAEYVSQAEGEQLRLAIQTLGQALKDAPDFVKETLYDMPRCQGEKINLVKILMLLLNDCMRFVGSPAGQLEVSIRLANIIQELKEGGHQELTAILSIALLRAAQSHNILAHDMETQQTFMGALNNLMPTLQADPLSISVEQIRQYWIALKICQEMAQPKAISIIFEAIIKIEQAQTQDSNRSDEERGRIAEDIISQHIDMAKLYWTFPQELQELFTNYTESTIALLKAFLEGDKESNGEELPLEDMSRMAGYYQNLGELHGRMGRTEESYNALVEAQILQMRIVGLYQKEEEGKMSGNGLMMRMALSVTNHMLAGLYRDAKKSQHDLSVVLTANMNLALECFAAYPRDGRVIHFAINAALELGEMQHSTGGLLAECGTYEKIIRQFVALNNMQIDGQICQDMAMIHTRCGQAQAHEKLRRYGDALNNLGIAQQLWTSLATNTKNPEFQKNADFVAQLISQIKK